MSKILTFYCPDIRKNTNMKFILTIFLLFLFSACSENQSVLSLNEKNYQETQDSLVKYKSYISENTESLSDYMKLDYQSYKAKYNLSEKEMEITRKSFNTTYEIAKAFKAIDQNMSRSNLPHPVKDSIKGNYSFDKNLKPANISKDEDVEVEVMMEAFEKNK